MSIRSPLYALALLTGILALPGLFGAGRTSAQAQPAATVQPAQAEITPERPPLEAVFACYRRAHDDTRLDGSAIADLCDGSAGAGPVDCYVAAHGRTGLSDADAIALCRCASSNEPVACFEYGRRTTTLDDGRILSLCAPAERFDLDQACMPPRR
jgi:hypothetical protein